SLPGLSILGAPVVGPATGPEPGGHDATAEGGPTDPATAGPADPEAADSGDTGAAGTGGTGTGGTGAAGTTDTGAFSALSVPVDPAGSGACNRLPNDESALAAAERQVVASRTARDTAKQRREVDEASGRLSIENARQGLVTAQNNRDAATTDRPSTLAQQRAVVDGAVAAVRQAQQDVDDAVLTAPVDGVVSVLNGAVGEYVAASAGTSALAPGSAAAIPGTDTAGGTPAATAVARPGGTQFLVLDGADTFQVVVPFEESDAALIQPNQNVDVTFEAVPDLVRRGTVLAVAPGATASSGVVGYYVTVLLTETDPRLRDGQTAQAAVRSTELRDVPTVPNAAVRRDGGRTTVTVVGVDGAARTVPFQAGLVGDDRTQVLSGLTVGDEVLLPTGRAA
ncbi:MAG TPA: HlyD family efflux transporter periplasmic adaptor subunit, partial [Pseudonocardia sp.]